MIAEPVASETAARAAEKLLLGDMTMETAETDADWLFTFVPKGRVRGGGFRVTVSKETGRVTDVLRYQ